LNLFAFEEEEDRRENRVLAEDEANRKDFLAQFVAISCSRSDWYNEGRSHRSFALWAAGSNQWIFQPTTTNGLGFLYLKKKIALRPHLLLSGPLKSQNTPRSDLDSTSRNEFYFGIYTPKTINFVS
jgi:hypothetical protein